MENSELSNIKNKFPGESVQKEKVKTQGVTNNSSNIFGNKFCEISVYNSKKKIKNNERNIKSSSLNRPLDNSRIKANNNIINITSKISKFNYISKNLYRHEKKSNVS